MGIEELPEWVDQEATRIASVFLGDPVSCSRIHKLVAQALVEAERRGEWRDMGSAPKDRSAIIIAVPTKDRDDFIVGEAYFDPENGGDWWWAGTGYGDYHGGPISEMNYWPPEFWKPLPLAPIRQLAQRSP